MIRTAGPRLHPVDAARRLAGRPGRFLLHSASDADGCGRWSFAGADPVSVVSGRAGDFADPFAAVADLAAGPPPDVDGPVPTVVGYFGYDLAQAVEPTLPPPRAGTGDHLWFGAYDAVWRHDALTGETALVGRDRDACARLAAALSKDPPVAQSPSLGPLHAGDPDEHLAGVARILDYIRAGDVYQVNLARRLVAAITRPGEPLALYERLAPAPFGAVLEAGARTLVSDSPELFLRRHAGSSRVETRPIKGTRARAADPAQLAADEKERAEHLMIVDLLRNDLGRVAAQGSVTVDDFCRVVTLPTVHHLVSTISCRTEAPTGELLRATFPGGSITGAPKVRAMEIIAELEGFSRGPYCGALGWLGPGGALDLSIVIRTAVLERDQLTLAVGGGVVADSTPARELAETEEKAAAWRDALTEARE